MCFCHSNLKSKMNLRIGSCLACVYRVMDAHGKFGEHDGRSARVAQGAAESNSSFLSALQTSQVHEPKAWTNSFITRPQQLGRKNMFYFWLTTISSHDARQRKTKVSIILTRHNQFSNSWMKIRSLNLSIKNLLHQIKQNYNENIAKQSTNTQWKWRQTKSKYSHWSKHLCQAKVKGSK